jgi:predicted RNA-binding protein YlxR (DUF448 family)
MCAVTRVRRPEDELLRFVADPNARIVFDLKRKLPGRGVWITASSQAVMRGVKTKAFARSLRAPVSADEDLAQEVQAALASAALGALGLANKAGCVVAGFAKVEAAIRSGKAVSLLHASDAAPGGREKLDRLYAGVTGNPASRGLDVFDSSAMSAVLGRANVNHAALLPGGASDAYIRAADRLRRYATSALTLAET